MENIVKKLKYKDKKMSEIIKTIEKNPEVLEKLNLERLKIINDYYIYQINEYKKRVSKK